MTPVILSIDCGTQSMRTLLFSGEGTLLDSEQVEYAPYYSEQPGWAEQDPELLWESLVAGCKALCSRKPDLMAAVKGVGVTTQRATMINVDAQGMPLRPAITWLDQRKAAPVFTPPFPVGPILSAVGVGSILTKVQQEGKGNWIRQNQPEIWEKTHKYLQVSGFLNHRLTGRFADSSASQIGHIPFNYKKSCWASRFDPSSLLFPMEREKLPEVVPPGEVLGHITPEAATATGLAQGLPVIACGSDKGCETLGMGVLSEETASLSFGTTATVQLSSRRYFEPLRFMPAYPAPVPGHWNPEIEIFRGYWMITWFKNEFAHKEVAKAEVKGIAPEAEMDRLLEKAPPGAMGLMVQPYWGPGLEHPNAKGAMIGFGDVHKKEHVYKAVIEGLGYALLEGLERLEKKTKIPVERLAVSGGASRSDQICQISADIFNRSLVRGKTTETSGLGAAIVTAVGLGIYKDFQGAIDAMVHYDTTFEPSPDRTALYRKLYQRVYKRIYPRLDPIYKEIREITGYPE
ncbi:FGGY-family carbohydrate kinase [Desulfoluna butyratoxydans]|uniref:Carbohydrate kinase fggy n-terminal n=1 Tax=Desulfoluna butyratoxydans TaxID=231438 RepID=A0A4U8YNQ4_9BACT|nr:FGGY-family carbohydrate kinase [Desulfoluna butyratoxydans]VFQ45391.1 carbohydrate kinase fggy n-terminal [Desulfoluna butyratoxydans]